MRWYQHDSNASSDAKIRKLVMRFGPIGYAVYFHCLELIAVRIEGPESQFDLEEDAFIIADNLNVADSNGKTGAEIVTDVMNYILELKLFEYSGERITCAKILRRLDTSCTSNPRMREIIKAAKAGPIRINQDKSDEIKINQISSAHITTLYNTIPDITKEEEGEAQAPEPPPTKIPFTYLWYKSLAKATSKLIAPSEDEKRKSIRLLERGFNANDLTACVEYYWQHWRELWWACVDADKQKPMGQRRPNHSFGQFLAHVDDLMALTPTAPAVNNLETLGEEF